MAGRCGAVGARLGEVAARCGALRVRVGPPGPGAAPRLPPSQRARLPGLGPSVPVRGQAAPRGVGRVSAERSFKFRGGFLITESQGLGTVGLCCELE